MDPQEAERIEAVLRADDRVADVAVLVVDDHAVPSTYIVVGARAGYEGKLPIGEFLIRAGLMGPTGAHCGMIQIGRFPRTASNEVDRANLIAYVERLVAGD
jgi:hypothetical protein